MAYNWEEIVAKYSTGKHTMQELADEYGFARDYGYTKVKEYGSSKGNYKKEVRNEVAERVISSEADKETKLRLKYEELIEKIRDGMMVTLFADEVQFDRSDRLRQFKTASQILETCRKEQWEINEIQDVARKVEQELSGSVKTTTEHDLSKLSDQELRTLDAISKKTYQE